MEKEKMKNDSLPKKRVAILYICTGQYVYFWKDFYSSFSVYFLPDAYKEFFVFTDMDELYVGNAIVHKIYQKKLDWPENTLFRFEMFLKISEQLKEFDYIFFFNANTICLKTIYAQEFLPDGEELLLVKHPGYYNKNKFQFPYERRKKSSAYVSYFKGDYYVFGAVNGGKAESFLQMAKKLSVDIQKDYQRGIIAKWHDESHLNAYIQKGVTYKILSPSYAYPEDWSLPFEKRIIILNKEKYILLDEKKIIELENNSLIKRCRRKIKDVIS